MNNESAHTFDLARFASREQVAKLHMVNDRACPHASVLHQLPAQWFGVHSKTNLPGVVSAIVARGDQGTTDRVIAAQREARDLQIPAVKELRAVLTHRRAVGQRYDLERVLSGDPKPWSRYERKTTAGSKIVSLYLPLGGTGDREAEEIAWSSVAAIVLVDLLEVAGYRVEVWGASRVSYDGSTFSLRAKLKDAGDTLDINAIARVAHPAIFRALYMPLRMAHWGRHAIGDGYGATCAVDPTAFGDLEGIALPHSYSLLDVARTLKAALTRFSDTQNP